MKIFKNLENGTVPGPFCPALTDACVRASRSTADVTIVGHECINKVHCQFESNFIKKLTYIFQSDQKLPVILFIQLTGWHNCLEVSYLAIPPYFGDGGCVGRAVEGSRLATFENHLIW